MKGKSILVFFLDCYLTNAFNYVINSNVRKEQLPKTAGTSVKMCKWKRLPRDVIIFRNITV